MDTMNSRPDGSERSERLALAMEELKKVESCAQDARNTMILAEVTRLLTWLKLEVATPQIILT